MPLGISGCHLKSPFYRCSGGAGWSVKSNYPALDSGRVFRLDWFDLFLNFITLMLIVVALFSKVIHQVTTREACSASCLTGLHAKKGCCLLEHHDRQNLQQSGNASLSSITHSLRVRLFAAVQSAASVGTVSVSWLG